MAIYHMFNGRKARKHRFGALRSWPKWKSVKQIWGILELLEKMELQNLMEEKVSLPNAARITNRLGLGASEFDFISKGWEAVAWRPLVSYR